MSNDTMLRDKSGKAVHATSAPPSACTVCGGRVDKILLKITEPDRFERHVGIGSGGYQRFWMECVKCGVIACVMGDDAEERLPSVPM